MPTATYGASDIITIITSLVHAHDKPRKDYLYQRETKRVRMLAAWKGPLPYSHSSCSSDMYPPLGNRPGSLPEATDNAICT